MKKVHRNSFINIDRFLARVLEYITFHFHFSMDFNVQIISIVQGQHLKFTKWKISWSLFITGIILLHLYHEASLGQAYGKYGNVTVRELVDYFRTATAARLIGWGILWGIFFPISWLQTERQNNIVQYFCFCTVLTLTACFLLIRT